MLLRKFSIKVQLFAVLLAQPMSLANAFPRWLVRRSGGRATRAELVRPNFPNFFQPQIRYEFDEFFSAQPRGPLLGVCVWLLITRSYLSGCIRATFEGGHCGSNVTFRLGRVTKKENLNFFLENKRKLCNYLSLFGVSEKI